MHSRLSNALLGFAYAERMPFLSLVFLLFHTNQTLLLFEINHDRLSILYL